MEVYKCTKKFKNNNIVMGYELIRTDGNTIQVDKDVLKQKIINKEVMVINLRVTDSNRIIDQKADKADALYREFFGGSTVAIHSREEKINKVGKIMGVLPELNKDGNLISVPKDKNVYITSECKSIILLNYSKVLILENTIEFFSAPIIPVDITIVANKCVIHCEGLMDKVINNNLSANEIVIDTETVDDKIIDNIFKSIKNGINNHYAMHNTRLYLIDSKKLNKDKAIEKMEKVLKRQKVSSKPGRRAYDLTCYIMLIKSMAASYSDESIYKKYTSNYFFELDKIIADKYHEGDPTDMNFKRAATIRYKIFTGQKK